MPPRLDDLLRKQFADIAHETCVRAENVPVSFAEFVEGMEVIEAVIQQALSNAYTELRRRNAKTYMQEDLAKRRYENPWKGGW